MPQQGNEFEKKFNLEGVFKFLAKYYSITSFEERGGSGLYIIKYSMGVGLNKGPKMCHLIKVIMFQCFLYNWYHHTWDFFARVFIRNGNLSSYAIWNQTINPMNSISANFAANVTGCKQVFFFSKAAQHMCT